jgi:flagellar basal body-associated protein FliL
VKKLYAVILVTFFIAVFASVGIASAETTTISGSAQVFFDKTPSPGAFVTLRVNFQSASSSELQLYRIGIHTDWQEENQYYTLTLSDLERVEANGFYSKSVSITIPTNTEVRTHTLTVAVDGYTADGSTFSWDSSPQSFDVAAYAPTVSPTTNQNGNNNTSSSGVNDIIIYAAVIAVVVVVVILVAVILMKRKSKAPAATPASYAPEPANTPLPQQAPQEQPPEDKEPEGKDFNI